MAEDLKISQMPSVTAIDGTERFPVVHGGQNKSVLMSGVRDFARVGMVAQEAGKGLSANDFTNALKQKLEGLVNFDDTQIQAKLTTLEQRLDTILGDGASSAIDTFNEIEAFLQGITDTETLTGLLADLKAEITAERNTALVSKVDKVTGKGLSTNDYTDTEKKKLGELPDNGQMLMVGMLLLGSGNVAPGSTSWRSSGFVALNREEPIVCHLLTNSNSDKAGGIFFYDASGKYISYINVTTDTDVTIPVTDFPEGAAFFRASSIYNASKINRYSNGGNIEQREGAVADAIIGKLDTSTWNADKAERDAERDAERKQFTLIGYITSDNGRVLGSNAVWSDISDLAAGNYSLHTEFIPVNRKYDIKVYSRPTPFHSAVAFYDANQNFISCHKVETTPSDFYEWTYVKGDIPADAVFFRLSSYVDKGLKLPWYIHAPNIESREGATSDAIAKSKVALFDDMWIAAGYESGAYFTSIDRTTDPTKPYVCNTLHLTYDEAHEVLQCSTPDLNLYTRDSIYAKTLIYRYNGWFGVNRVNTFNRSQLIASSCHRLIVLRISDDNSEMICSKGAILFGNCSKLETVLGVINIAAAQHIIYKQLPALVNVKFKGLNANFGLPDSPLLSLESLQYLVTNAANGTTAITVTVHPTVYAKLTDTSNTEWHAVMTAAVAKNISFATNA